MSSFGGIIKDDLRQVFVFKQGDSWYYWVDEKTSTGPFDTYEDARKAWKEHIDS